MKIRNIVLLGILVLLVILRTTFYISKQKTTIPNLIVYNAASTTDLIDEIGLLFYRESGIKISTNPGGSGTLAKQLENGGMGNIYISASKKWMNYVNELNLIKYESAFLKNDLVLITPIKSTIKPFTISSDVELPLLFKGRISLGDPDFVPAGAYAKEALEYYNWYNVLKSRIQPAQDVRAALSIIELNEADLGIVYSSDAKKSDKVRVVATFPTKSHTPVEYYLGVLNNSSEIGEQFYNFLLTNKDVKLIYEKYGFSIK